MTPTLWEGTVHQENDMNKILLCCMWSCNSTGQENYPCYTGWKTGFETSKITHKTHSWGGSRAQTLKSQGSSLSLLSVSPSPWSHCPARDLGLAGSLFPLRRLSRVIFLPGLTSLGFLPKESPSLGFSWYQMDISEQRHPLSSNPWIWEWIRSCKGKRANMKVVNGYLVHGKCPQGSWLL